MIGHTFVFERHECRKWRKNNNNNQNTNTPTPKLQGRYGGKTLLRIAAYTCLVPTQHTGFQNEEGQDPRTWVAVGRISICLPLPTAVHTQQHRLLNTLAYRPFPDTDTRTEIPSVNQQQKRRTLRSYVGPMRRPFSSVSPGILLFSGAFVFRVSIHLYGRGFRHRHPLGSSNCRITLVHKNLRKIYEACYLFETVAIIQAPTRQGKTTTTASTCRGGIARVPRRLFCCYSFCSSVIHSDPWMRLSSFSNGPHSYSGSSWIGASSMPGSTHYLLLRSVTLQPIVWSKVAIIDQGSIESCALLVQSDEVGLEVELGVHGVLFHCASAKVST